MTLFLPDFHISLAILAPNHRICAILPRFRISHLSLERVFYKALPRHITSNVRFSSSLERKR